MKDPIQPKASVSDLRERQSVRATFNLTAGCIDAIRIVATQMGIKQKSIFENLADDVEGLKTIAREIESPEHVTQGRIRKTYVISRRALASIDDVAGLFKISRHTLVEYAVQRLLPIIDRGRTKHVARKRFFESIEAHFVEGQSILNDIKRELGHDDPVIDKFSTVMTAYEVAKGSIAKFISKSVDIEDFNSDDMYP